MHGAWIKQIVKNWQKFHSAPRVSDSLGSHILGKTRPNTKSVLKQKKQQNPLDTFCIQGISFYVASESQ